MKKFEEEIRIPATLEEVYTELGKLSAGIGHMAFVDLRSRKHLSNANTALIQCAAHVQRAIDEKNQCKK